MQRNAIRRALARAAATGAAAAIAVLTLSGPAGAHVTVATDSAAAGSYALLTFSVPHGCDGEPTTEVAIQIPEPLNAVTPSVNPNWELEKVFTELPEPVTDSHGNEVTERVSEVVYTANTPLPEGVRDAFELSLRLPEETAGQTLHFPVVQVCGDAEHPWIEIAEEGQDPDELESPAPSIEVIAPDAAAADEDAAAAAESESEPTAADEEDGDEPLLYTAIALGAIGVLLGALALVRGRRRA